MFLLALDTATPAISAALAEVSGTGVRILEERVTIDGRAHGELLAPQIESVLDAAGVKPADVAAIAAGVGPGPFTGLRVGLVTAAVMGSALDIPTYGVSTLDVMGAATSGDVLVATDARRREVYWAVYRDGSRADSAPAVDKPADLAPILVSRGIRAGVGEGAAKYADVLGVSVGELRYPPLAQLARLAADRVLTRAPSEQLTPLYLRRPDAETPAHAKAATSARADATRGGSAAGGDAIPEPSLDRPKSTTLQERRGHDAAPTPIAGER